MLAVFWGELIEAKCTKVEAGSVPKKNARDAVSLRKIKLIQLKKSSIRCSKLLGGGSTKNTLVDPPSRLGACGKGWEGGLTKNKNIMGRPPPPD